MAVRSETLTFLACTAVREANIAQASAQVKSSDSDPAARCRAGLERHCRLICHNEEHRYGGSVEHATQYAAPGWRVIAEAKSLGYILTCDGGTRTTAIDAYLLSLAMLQL
jgi:hypothetical protein